MRDRDSILLENLYVKEILNEAPIDTFEKIGEWGEGDKPRGWDKVSRKILNSPAGVEKIKKLWNKLPEDVDMYMVSNKEGWNYTEIGEVDEEWVKKNLKLDIPINHEHITIIYTNNKGSEKVPATGWTLAHRFGHALRRSKGFMNNKHTSYGLLEKDVQELISKIAEKIYNHNVNVPRYDRKDYQRISKIKLEISHGLGIFKSARDKNLRNDSEFTNELVAQYIVTGDIIFNKELPNILALKYAWGKPQGPYKKHIKDESEKREIEQLISDYEYSIKYLIEDMLSAAIGKIFVM